MTAPSVPPPWINPAFRLVEADRTWDWPAMDALAIRIGNGVPEHGRIAVAGRSVAAVLGALVAADRKGIEVVLLRSGMTGLTAQASHLVEADGRLTKLGPPVATVEGFAVLIATSGTSGEPKLVRHDFRRLLGRIAGKGGEGVRWLLTYEPTGFGGLQVILAAVAAGALLVAAPGRDAAAMAALAIGHDVSHVSGTPSFWRSFLMTLGDRRPPLRVITLGGETADQAVLDHLADAYPSAHIGHLYASTEAGALFMVRDRQAGFPKDWLETGVEGVELRVRGGILEIRSPRAMTGFADGTDSIRTSDGWLVTGDLVEVVEDRVLFAGRADGLVNVGGVKVNPERAERLIQSLPGVRDARVSAAPNPVTGAVLTAEVVAEPDADRDALKQAIGDTATASLSAAERPRLITFVDRLALAPSGKKIRTMGLS